VHHHTVERTIFGDIVQIKNKRRVPVVRCRVIETFTSLYCCFLSARGAIQFKKLREPLRVEVQDCGLAQTTGKLTNGGKEFPVNVGTSTSHTAFLVGDLMDTGDCTTSIIKTRRCKKLGGQAAQAVYKVNFMEKYAKINNLSRIITFVSGIAAKIGD
jgi:hypothetical protein